MPTINLKDFSVGLMTEPDKADIPLEALIVAENVDLSDGGKKKKRRGALTLVSAPTGVTPVSFCRIRFTRPSLQDVTILYGQDGSGRDELWWRPYWNPDTEAWVDGWQEMSEFEGVLTAQSGTAADSIVCTDLANDTDDYYNRWVVLNLTRQATAEVYDYDGGTNTLTLRDEIASQSDGDTFLIYRFPLTMSLEGLNTMDGSSSSTTTLVDTALRATLNDFYVGWKVYNKTRSAEATVTAYDAAAKKLTHGTIANQADSSNDDDYYIYKDTHELEVESGQPVRFFPRENAVEMSVGVGNGYPKKAPLWLGFISERYFFDQDKTSSSKNTRFEGFWVCRNVMDKPDSSIIDVTDEGSGTLADDTWYFRAAFIYDGYQESPLSDAVSLNPASTNEINIDININLWSAKTANKPGYYDGAVLNKRITAIKIYVAKGDDDDANLDYFQILHASVINTDRVVTQAFGSFEVWKRTSDLYSFSILGYDLSDEVWTGGSASSVTGATFGKFKKWTVYQGHDSRRVDVNYRHRATLQEVHYKAPVFIDQAYDTVVQMSLQSNGAGSPADDIMPINNDLPGLSAKGVNKITGISHVNGELIILSPDRVFRYAPDQYLVGFSPGKGCVAENGYLVYDDVLYWVGIEDVFAYNGQSIARMLDGRIGDQYRGYTDSEKEGAKLGILENLNNLYLLIAGDLYIFSLTRGYWSTYAPSVTDLLWLAPDVDGNLYGATTNAIWRLEDAQYQGALQIHTRSKIIDLSKEVGGRRIPTRGILKRLLVRHSSTEKLVYKIFDPLKSETYPVKTVTLFPGSKNGVDLDVEIERFYLDLQEVAYSGASAYAQEATVEMEQIEWQPIGS